MRFIKRLMEIKEWQAENEQTQTLILNEILKVLKEKEQYKNLWMISVESDIKEILKVLKGGKKQDGTSNE